MSAKLVTVPCTRRQANVAIQKWHRHHSPMNDAIFCVAVATEADLVVHGVALVGRPATHALEDGWTCEVRRLATDGTPNACSALLGACRRAAGVLGYSKIQTYTMAHEGGASLRAAGWSKDALTDGTSNFSSRVAPRCAGGVARAVGKIAMEDRRRQLGIKVRWCASAQQPEREATHPTYPVAPPDHPQLFAEGPE